MDNIEAPETTTAKSASRIAFGLVLLLVSIAAIFWNESSTTERYQKYQDGPGQTISLPSPSLSPANDGKLVYFKGSVSVDGELRDRQLGVSGNAIKIRRTVLLYQWSEKQKTSPPTKSEDGQVLPEKVEYAYSKKWLDGLNETITFKKPIDPKTNEYRVNPTKKLFESMELTAEETRVGDFVLPEELMASFQTYEKLPVQPELINQFPEEWKARVKIVDGEYYIGKGSYENPRVGDYRIFYEAVTPGDIVSVLGKQNGNKIESFFSRLSGDVKKIRLGSHPLEAMFGNITKGNPPLEWGVRVVSIALALAGSWMFFGGLGIAVSWPLFAISLISLSFAYLWQVYEMLSYGLYGVGGMLGLLFLKSLISIGPKMPKLSSRKKDLDNSPKENIVTETPVVEEAHEVNVLTEATNNEDAVENSPPPGPIPTYEENEVTQNIVEAQPDIKPIVPVLDETPPITEDSQVETPEINDTPTTNSDEEISFESVPTVEEEVITEIPPETHTEITETIEPEVTPVEEPAAETPPLPPQPVAPPPWEEEEKTEEEEEIPSMQQEVDEPTTETLTAEEGNTGPLEFATDMDGEDAAEAKSEAQNDTDEKDK